MGRASARWVLVLAASSLVAWAATEKTGASKAGFDAKGPAGFALHGSTRDLQLEDDGATLTVVVPLANLDTGIGLRNRHMKEKYLQVEKYPDARLEVPWQQLHLPGDGQELTGKGEGKMTIHGVTRDVTVSWKIKRAGDSYWVEGSVPLNLTNFGIEVPRYLGLTVQPDIVATASFSAKHN